MAVNIKKTAEKEKEEEKEKPMRPPEPGGMLEEALRFLAFQAVEATRPQVTPLKPTETVLVRDAAGNLVKFEGRVAARNHVALAVDAIKAYWERGESSVWYSRNGVVLLVKDTSRLDKVTMPLEPSAPMAKLMELAEKRTWFKQSDFVVLLRTTFRDCLEADAGFLPLVSNLEFKYSEDSGGSMGHGKQSLGKKVRAEVANAGAVDFPDVVRFFVPVFRTNFSAYQEVVVPFLIDETQKTFALAPQEQDLEKAFRLAEKELAAALVDAGIENPIFGVP